MALRDRQTGWQGSLGRKAASPDVFNLVGRFQETHQFKLSDRVTTSPLSLEKPGRAQRSWASRRMAAWPGRRPRPSFKTHRWSLSSGARSRDPLAMLLRMRSGEASDIIRTSETLIWTAASPKASRLGRGDDVAKMAETDPQFEISLDHRRARSDPWHEHHRVPDAVLRPCAAPQSRDPRNRNDCVSDMDPRSAAYHAASAARCAASRERSLDLGC
jgi:hypothetical protein